MKFAACFMICAAVLFGALGMAAQEDAVSVHVSEIKPIVTESFDSEHPLKNADTAVEIISQLRGWKSERKLSLKEEIARAEVTLPEGVQLPEDAVTDIKATCAVKELAFTSGSELAVKVCE